LQERFSFFSLLKIERIKQKIFRTRSEARAEIFDYIEFFYNPKRHHGNNGGLSPLNDEKLYFEKLENSEQLSFLKNSHGFLKGEAFLVGLFRD